jgi:hypothetical protein
LINNENGIESWGIKETKQWKLKIKAPSTNPEIHEGSKKWRYSARDENGKYFDPATNKTGSRKELGHNELDPN